MYPTPLGRTNDEEVTVHRNEYCSRRSAEKYSISDGTYYNSKAKYGSMEASAIKWRKDLEEENRRLKTMLADLSLEHNILKNIVEKSYKASSSARTC